MALPVPVQYQPYQWWLVRALLALIVTCLLAVLLS